MTALIGLTTLAAAPPGGYFSTVKILFTAALLLPWLYAATWISKDAVRVHTSQIMWSALVLASGALALLLLLLLPWYAVGLVLYVVAVAAVVGAYVGHRNKRVVPKARVLTSEHLRTVFASKKHRRVEVVQRLKLYDNLGRPVAPPEEEEPEKREVYNLTQNFLHNVVMFRASQVDLTPTGARTVVRFVVDGVVQQRPPADREEAERVIDFIKQLSGMDLEERRRPQHGKISVELGAVMVDITTLTAGTTHGQRLQMKIVQEVARTNLDDLGMPEDVRERLERLNAAPDGLIIVSGPRGNGVTSTMYSLLRRHDAFMKILASVEKSPTVDLENVTQQTYKDQTEMPGRLASLLRRDPDVVMVDRCDTAQAAALICDAAASKNLLLGSTADSAFKALARWVKVTGDPARAVAHLKAVTCQVLLRKLCPGCREGYRPARDLLAKLNLPGEKVDKFYRPPTKPLTDEKGNPVVCPTCRGTGYFGRTAAFELLEMNDEIRELIVRGAPLTAIKKACRKNRMLYLQEQALRKVMEGVTSIEEVIRVSKDKQK